MRKTRIIEGVHKMRFEEILNRYEKKIVTTMRPFKGEKF